MGQGYFACQIGVMIRANCKNDAQRLSLAGLGTLSVEIQINSNLHSITVSV